MITSVRPGSRLGGAPPARARAGRRHPRPRRQGRRRRARGRPGDPAQGPVRGLAGGRHLDRGPARRPPGRASRGQPGRVPRADRRLGAGVGAARRVGRRGHAGWPATRRWPTWALRYFRSHGPATVADFAWWTGLKVSDSRAAHAAVADQLERLDVGGADLLAGPGHAGPARHLPRRGQGGAPPARLRRAPARLPRPQRRARPGARRSGDSRRQRHVPGLGGRRRPGGRHLAPTGPGQRGRPARPRRSPPSVAASRPRSPGAGPPTLGTDEQQRGHPGRPEPLRRPTRHRQRRLDLGPPGSPGWRAERARPGRSR